MLLLWLWLGWLAPVLADFYFDFERDVALPAAVGAFGRDDHSTLSDFLPIANFITQSETQYYSFAVNTLGGIGEFYELLIFITGNICEQPANASEGALTVYYSFNALMFANLEIGQMVQFANGYFQALADVPVAAASATPAAAPPSNILYIAVRAPEYPERTAGWRYEIGVLQNDLVFQWDDRAWALLVDTDDTLALIVTGNLTSRNPGRGRRDAGGPANITALKYHLFLYLADYRHHFALLNLLWCAIRNGPSLFGGAPFELLYTLRLGGMQQQFYVPNLNASTTYIAYLVLDFSGTAFGGAVYQPFEFTTLSTDACELIYDLDFCDTVAYAVPNAGDPQAVGHAKLRALYDERARLLYANFSKALQQVACDTTSNAIFLPILLCADCAQLYKDWLCAVTIPRCLTRNILGYRLRANALRNAFIDTEVAPRLDYYEVLPCVNVCEAVVRTCPADFGFVCPTTNALIAQLYYWDDGGEYETCNYVGKRVWRSWGVKRVAQWHWVVLAAAIAVI